VISHAIAAVLVAPFTTPAPDCPQSLSAQHDRDGKAAFRLVVDDWMVGF
jgi:hypothetical protein